MILFLKLMFLESVFQCMTIKVTVFQLSLLRIMAGIHLLKGLLIPCQLNTGKYLERISPWKVVRSQ
ncbi:hypothetical protein WM46_06000 [Citrobacter freundii complex sp. CFNIH2]|nr:hypothetical protein WM46_06000 [Citrobacter freundii complex sp. CFNIH2]